MRDNEVEFVEILNRPLLDVRAPVEFEQAHLPKSLNIPILTDSERRQVGICYKQDGSQAAEKLGFSLVSGMTRDRRIANWLGYVKEKNPAALLCWRGGKRSEIAQGWLSDVGASLPRIRGGYKAARSFILNEFQKTLRDIRIFVISGRTGAGKTELLREYGGPDGAIDLEGMAHHSGSAFGGLFSRQPAQATFENELALELYQLYCQGKRVIFVEDEGPLIGRLTLPHPLREVMASAEIIYVDESRKTRAERILREYIAPLYSAPQASGGEVPLVKLLRCLERIQKRLGGVRTLELKRFMKDASARSALSDDLSVHLPWINRLLEWYYDPRYDYGFLKKRELCVFRGSLDEVREYLGGSVTVKHSPISGYISNHSLRCTEDGEY